jgi:hypothetical protein
VGRFVTAAAREVKHGLGLGRRDADLMRDYLRGYVAERLGPATAGSHLGLGSQRVTYAS